MNNDTNLKKIMNENNFVRKKIFNKKMSELDKYCSFTIGKYSLPMLLKYEIITSLFGSIPGALGLFLRSKIYRFLFKDIGKNVIFGRYVTIRCPDNIKLGNNVFIDDYCFLDGRGASDEKIIIEEKTILNRHSYIQSKEGKIHIGPNVSIGTGSVIISQGGIEIGKWVSLAGGSKISGGMFKIVESESEESMPFHRYSNGTIHVGEYSIIGSGSVIIDGISVGKRCMVGPGSIVVKNIPDDTVVSAYPAMILRRQV
jgi:acetyltransferase-like isoleucine patch superfamily enzyme